MAKLIRVRYDELAASSKRPHREVRPDEKEKPAKEAKPGNEEKPAKEAMPAKEAAPAARLDPISFPQLAAIPDLVITTGPRTNADMTVDPAPAADPPVGPAAGAHPVLPAGSAGRPAAGSSAEGAEKIGFAARPLWLRPSGRPGRHARGAEVRSGGSPSLSIRSAEVRNWSADLNGPGPAGLVVYGLGGIGKSTLAGQVAARISRLRSGHVVTTLTGEVSAASFPAEPTETDFIILENFDDNLTPEASGWTVRDPALVTLLATWPGKLLITCRSPFTLVTRPPTPASPPDGQPASARASRAVLPAGVMAAIPPPRQPPLRPYPLHPDPAGQNPPFPDPLISGPAPASRARPGRDRLVFRQLGPLTRSSARELAAALPAIRLLPDAERDHLWRLTAGHPLAMEYLDSVLALGARFPDVAERIETMIQARNGQPLPRTEPTAWPEATASLIASAAGDQLISELFARLSAGARALMVRASVFRVPVSSDALAARPGLITEIQGAGLLARPGAGISVHRWTADRLHGCLTEAGLGAQVVSAHEQAARYWRTQAVASGAGDRADLEACYHERHATDASSAERTARRQFGPPAGTWRRRVIGIGVAGAMAVVAAVLTVLAVQAPQGVGASHLASSDGLAASAPVTAAAAVRGQAAAWASQQVSGGAIMACDPAMCSVLAKHGIVAGNLLVLGSGASDPLGSDVVFATAALRGIFGGRLASVYAPEVLASFGSGQARIDVLAVAPDGAAAYRTALAADVRARRVAGAQLLRDPKITFSASARAQLTSGQVDARLLIATDTLAASEPVRVDAFLAEGPGASPGLPLRAAQLSAAPGPAQGILAFFRAQRPPYLPARTSVSSGSGGAVVLTVQFAAPAPLGLLPPSS